MSILNKVKFSSAAFLLILYQTGIECCTKATFNNTVIKVAYSGDYEPSVTTVVSGCITHERLGERAVTQIECHNQSIPVFYEGAVANLPEAFLLTFSFSKIKQIQQKAIINVPRLTYLGFGDNDIDTIHPDAFLGLEVSTLHLSRNKLAFLEDGIFASLPKLQHIVLDGNQLVAFDSQWFSKTFNPLALHINNNFIQTIQKHTFKGYRSVQTIDLSHNRIQYMHEEAFTDLESLRSLDLSDNRIKKLDRDAFKSLKKLIELWLHGNNLTYIYDKNLQDLSSLFQFSIHTNPWQCACYNNILKLAHKNSLEVVPGVDCLNTNNPLCVVRQEHGDLCLEHRDEDLNKRYYDHYSFNNECFEDEL